MVATAPLQLQMIRPERTCPATGEPCQLHEGEDACRDYLPGTDRCLTDLQSAPAMVLVSDRKDGDDDYEMPARVVGRHIGITGQSVLNAQAHAFYTIEANAATGHAPSIAFLAQMARPTEDGLVVAIRHNVRVMGRCRFPEAVHPIAMTSPHWTYGLIADGIYASVVICEGCYRFGQVHVKALAALERRHGSPPFGSSRQVNRVLAKRERIALRLAMLWARRAR